MIWKATIAVCFAWNIALSCVLGYFLCHGAISMAQTQTLEYKDFVAILLTALGVMIAVGAFFIAILAVWTYKNAMELIESAARDEAKTVATKTAEGVAGSVAARTTMDAPISETDAQEAEAIVAAVTSEKNG
ncbi:MAG: hypothetical protein AB7K64_21405 [Variibacter sp.]